MARVPRAGAAFLAVGLSLLVPARGARADDTIKHPGDHPDYLFEAEPHIVLGWGGVYGTEGFGVGARFGIPIVKNGFVSSINNSVAISFGADLVHYDSCWYNDHAGCSANYLVFPVAMQWNFYVAQRWSVFGEPGLILFQGFLADCPNGMNCRGALRSSGWSPPSTSAGATTFRARPH